MVHYTYKKYITSDCESYRIGWKNRCKSCPW
ncbi:unnamed protein product, partial [Larinioides sclopetarius]